MPAAYSIREEPAPGEKGRSASAWPREAATKPTNALTLYGERMPIILAGNRFVLAKPQDRNSGEGQANHDNRDQLGTIIDVTVKFSGEES
jgi:hypothetical protein